MNTEHVDEVTELYTVYNQNDEDVFSQAKKELISMRSSGEFKIGRPRPILKTVRPMRQQ